MPRSLAGGSGWGELACGGGSTDFGGGAARWPAESGCGVAARGSGLTCPDGSMACAGAVARWPKFGFSALHSVTSRPSICGRGLLDRRGRSDARIMGAMQSTKRPSPVLAPPCTNPACSHAALISAQARWRGAACTGTIALKPRTNVPKMAVQIWFRYLFIARLRRLILITSSGPASNVSSSSGNRAVRRQLDRPTTAPRGYLSQHIPSLERRH
jgi:hypothetical protein